MYPRPRQRAQAVLLALQSGATWKPQPRFYPYTHAPRAIIGAVVRCGRAQQTKLDTCFTFNPIQSFVSRMQPRAESYAFTQICIRTLALARNHTPKHIHTNTSTYTKLPIHTYPSTLTYKHIHVNPHIHSHMHTCT
jgi:hypothetical protein